MRNFKKRNVCLATVLVTLLLGLSMGANAAMLRAEWSGTISGALNGNALGVQAGDTVGGYVTFDTAWLLFLPDDGVYVIDHRADPAYEVGLTIGNRTFVESEDALYGFDSSFPTPGFLDISSTAALEETFLGMLFGTCSTPEFPHCATSDGLGIMSFIGDDPTAWAVFDDAQFITAGNWSIDTVQIQAVPVPAALPLLLGALGALFGFGRRSV